MKKILAIITLFFILFWFAQAYSGTTVWTWTTSTNWLVWRDRDEHGCIPSAWYSWNEEKKQCTRPWEEDTQDKTENLICTMQYAPVCWVNWKTYWNSCSAWKNEIAYAWECDTYIDSSLLKKLERNTSSINKKLSLVSNSKLEKAVEKADKLIANTKLLKIAEVVQKERITKLYFLKQLIQKKINIIE